MTTMFVRHKVADYAKWRRVYDEFDATRKRLGVTGDRVYRDADDPSGVTVTHNFKDISTAKAFVSSEDLRSAMERAGVAGPPEIWFGEES
jgi:quinol monooxygenase YgiN